MTTAPVGRLRVRTRTGSRPALRPALRAALHPLTTSAFALALTATMPVVLLAGWLAADALQPATYSPLHRTISVAAGHAGTDRWVGTAALLAIGIGYLLCAIALPVPPGPGRLGLLATGICGLGVALCPESASGPTASHEFFSVLGAVLLAAGPLFTMQRSGTGAARPSTAVAAAVVFTAITAYLVFELNAGTLGGFAERLAVTVETGWPLVLALTLRSKLTTDVISELSRS